MDPNANLREQREHVRDIYAINDSADSDTGEYTEDQELALVGHASRLAELVEALDGWITGGGFLPSAWNRK